MCLTLMKFNTVTSCVSQQSYQTNMYLQCVLFTASQPSVLHNCKDCGTYLRGQKLARCIKRGR